MVDFLEDDGSVAPLPTAIHEIDEIVGGPVAEELVSFFALLWHVHKSGETLDAEPVPQCVFLFAINSVDGRVLLGHALPKRHDFHAMRTPRGVEHNELGLSAG